MKDLNRVSKKPQIGHVMAEWVMTTFVITIILFAPLPGTDQSIVAMMTVAIRDFYENNSYLLSLP